MSRRKHHRKPVWTIVLALITGTLAILPATQAQADIPQGYTAPSVYPHRIDVHGDGTLTLGECPSFNQAYTSNRQVSVAPDGLTTTALPEPTSSDQWRPIVCDGGTVAGTDGSLYIVEQRYTPNGYSNWRIAAYKNNVLLWAKSLQMCPNNQVDGHPTFLTLGYDGNIYAIMDATCTPAVADKLIGINATTGGLTFTPIPMLNDFQNFVYFRPRLSTHSGGIEVLDGLTVHHYGFNGSVGSSYSLPLNGTEAAITSAFNGNGRLYVATHDSTKTGCSYPNSRVDRLIYLDPDGTSGSFDVSAQCHELGLLHALPSGGVLLQNTNPAYNSISAYTASGTLTYSISLGSIVGYQNVYVGWVSVDANGTVVVQRSGQQTSGQYDRYTFVDTVNSSGVMTRQWDNSFLSTSASFENLGYLQGEHIAIANGKIYIPSCSAPCSVSNPAKIYTIAVAGLSIDYPRSAIFGAIEAAQGVQKVYAALGDSFASVEGNPPFLPGTDISGNRCHRSANAYAMKLDQDASLDLNLQSFRACSGATTVTLSDGMNGENGQLDSLNGDTDAVTVSIGGNDIDFGNGMTACSLTTDPQVCEDTLSVINGNVHSPWFQERIHDTYEAIKAKVTKPNARVFVIGYPLLMGMPGLPHCNWYLHSMTSTEEALVDDIGATLNSIIADEATDAGFTFVPLDNVFAGHTPCSTTPYINGVDLVHNEYSYHPNSAGVQAIYEEIKAAL